MSYARKEERFWTDPELRKMNYTARYLFDWFFTNPQRHFSGVYFYEKSIISPQTGIPLKLIDKSIKELVDHGFIRVCNEHSVVFVLNMLKHQTSENTLSPTQTVGIKNHLKSLHCKCFESEFNNKYSHLFSEKDIPWKKKREPIHIPIDTPIHTVMHTNSNSNSNKNPPSPLKRGNGVDEEFEIWWKAYPGRRKQGKPVCLAKWKHLAKSGTLPPFTAMMFTLESQKQSLDWIKDAGEFIPGPLPYLNQSKFFDESIQTPGPQGVSPKARNPDCPRCHGKGLYKSGETPDHQPIMSTCQCEKENGQAAN